jgi:hypothetical protein
MNCSLGVLLVSAFRRNEIAFLTAMYQRLERE